MDMDGIYGNGGVKLFFCIALFFMLISVSFSQGSSNSVWRDFFHPKQTVKITSKIQGGTVRVKCISSENDIKGGYLNPEGTFKFDVELKLLTTIRYNCLLTQGGREIGQFLGFRSGSYCDKGCTWELYRHYALRISSRNGFVNQTYKPIGSPDDHNYDFSL